MARRPQQRCGVFDASSQNAVEASRKQVGLNMRATLYDDLAKLAKDNGQTTTYVLEQAAEHYIRFVAPTQSVVRPEIMAHVRRSVDKNRKLLQLLAE